MEIKAHARYLRMSPRRIRLLADVVRGLSVSRALEQLSVIPRRAAEPLAKLLQSAVANAEQNFDCLEENLYVRSIMVNEGPMLKRSTPRAFGRATPIRKRSAHITLVLGEREEGKKGGRARREAHRVARRPKTSAPHAHTHEEKRKEGGETQEKKPTPTISGRLAGRHHVEGAKENVHDHKKSKGFLKRLFNRKSG